MRPLSRAPKEAPLMCAAGRGRSLGGGFSVHVREPIGENKPLRVDEYDILQDIKNLKANVTIGQLLHDNANYHKKVREAYIRPRRRRIRLPPVAGSCVL